MRLHKVMPDYQGRVRVRVRPFPLEVADSGPAPRDILEQEWWLAAIQEPAADFAPYEGDDWPATTLTAFEAAWCAFRQGEEAGHNYDLQVSRAFFAEGEVIQGPAVRNLEKKNRHSHSRVVRRKESWR